jgi:hypothetical protein
MSTKLIDQVYLNHEIHVSLARFVALPCSRVVVCESARYVPHRAMHALLIMNLPCMHGYGHL